MSIAEKYAESLLEVAKDRNCLEEVKNNFLWLVRRLCDNDQLRFVFVSPLFSGPSKKAALDRIVSDVFCEEFVRFLYVVADKKREKYIFDIYRHFTKIVDDHENKIHVQVRTVFPLDAGLSEKLAGKLREKTGKEIVLENLIDKKLIGGAVVKMNDFVLDCSVLNGLNLLEKELLS